LTEGEVAVSAGGIICPLLVGGLAATWLSWRFAFALGAVLVVVAAGFVRLPAPALLGLSALARSRTTSATPSP
jgi:MFS family permease